MKRCAWAGAADRLMLQYHDWECAVPIHDDRKHFESFSCSKGRRPDRAGQPCSRRGSVIKRAFSEFDLSKVVRYSAYQIRKLTLDQAIVRNRMKIEAAVENAHGVSALFRKNLDS